MKIKYTRYDLKKRRNNNFLFIIMIVSILILAFIIGSVFSKLFMKNSLSKSTINNKRTNEEKKLELVKKKDKIFKFVAIQGGIFRNEDYLNGRKNILTKYGNPFIVKTERGNRLFLGIYEEKQSKNVIKNLNDNKIDNSRMTFTLNCNDICDVEIGEIIKAYLDIINKFSNKNIKSVNIQEFKKWTNSLEEPKNNSRNKEVLKELKGYINKLPNYFKKDIISKNYAFAFNILQKINR